jgi:RES domain
LELPSLTSYTWSHRFDDPERRFRTLYCARSRLTCLREVLASLSPNLKDLQRFKELFGDDGPAAGELDWKFREQRALAPAFIEISSGELVRLDDLKVRNRLEMEHAGIFLAHGLERLDISLLRSKNRIVTQILAGLLFDQGFAGIVYGSNVDDRLCVAVFEGRARLVPAGNIQPLSEPVRGLGRVCQELGLRRGRRPRRGGGL